MSGRRTTTSARRFGAGLAAAAVVSLALPVSGGATAAPAPSAAASSASSVERAAKPEFAGYAATATSTPVKIELEGVPTYLADSMQFLLEYGCRMHEAGTYYVMPSFRGEAPDPTHLCQFYHSEAEVAGGLDDVMATVEDYVRHLARDFLDEMEDVIAEVAGGTDHLRRVLELRGPFPRITFADAVAELGDGPDVVQQSAPGIRSLTRAAERQLMDRFGEFVWVTHFDHLSVPFYQAFEPGDPSVARAGDLLFWSSNGALCRSKLFSWSNRCGFRS